MSIIDHRTTFKRFIVLRFRHLDYGLFFFGVNTWRFFVIQGKEGLCAFQKLFLERMIIFCFCHLHAKFKF